MQPIKNCLKDDYVNWTIGDTKQQETQLNSVTLSYGTTNQAQSIRPHRTNPTPYNESFQDIINTSQGNKGDMLYLINFTVY